MLNTTTSCALSCCKLETRELDEVLDAECDKLCHDQCSLSVNVGRIFVEPVIMSEDEVPRQLLREKICERLEWQMKEVVAFPVDLFGCHIEGDTDSRFLKELADHVLKERQHLLKRKIAFGCEDSVRDDVIEKRQFGATFQNI